MLNEHSLGDLGCSSSFPMRSSFLSRLAPLGFSFLVALDCAARFSDLQPQDPSFQDGQAIQLFFCR